MTELEKQLYSALARYEGRTTTMKTTKRGRPTLDLKRKMIGVVLAPSTIALFNSKVPAFKRSAFIEELLLKKLNS